MIKLNFLNVSAPHAKINHFQNHSMKKGFETLRGNDDNYKGVSEQLSSDQDLITI